MSRNDIDMFHVFQAREEREEACGVSCLRPSHFGEPFTIVGMASSTRRRTLGRWPSAATLVGSAALGILALLGNIHSAKGGSFVIVVHVQFIFAWREKFGEQVESARRPVSRLLQATAVALYRSRTTNPTQRKGSVIVITG